jgi:hypothetical protein
MDTTTLINTVRVLSGLEITDKNGLVWLCWKDRAVRLDAYKR